MSDSKKRKTMNHSSPDTSLGGDSQEHKSSGSLKLVIKLNKPNETEEQHWSVEKKNSENRVSDESPKPSTGLKIKIPTKALESLEGEKEKKSKKRRLSEDESKEEKKKENAIPTIKIKPPTQPTITPPTLEKSPTPSRKSVESPKLKAKQKSPKLKTDPETPPSQPMQVEQAPPVSTEQPSVPVQPPRKFKFLPLRKTLNTILNHIIKKDIHQLFYDPVSAEDVPDYHSIIRRPMDFQTMRKKLRNGEYPYLNIMEHDFETVCRNAMIYNAPETIFYQEAEKLLQVGKQIIQNYLEKIDPEKMKSSRPLPRMQMTIEDIEEKPKQKEKKEENQPISLKTPAKISTPKSATKTPTIPTKSRTKVTESKEKQAEKFGISLSNYNMYLPQGTYETTSYNMYNRHISNYLNYTNLNGPLPKCDRRVIDTNFDSKRSLKEYIEAIQSKAVEPLKSYLDSLNNPETKKSEPFETKLNIDSLKKLALLHSDDLDLSFLGNIEPSLREQLNLGLTSEQQQVQEQLDRNFQLLYFLQLSQHERSSEKTQQASLKEKKIVAQLNHSLSDLISKIPPSQLAIQKGSPNLWDEANTFIQQNPNVSLLEHNLNETLE